MAASCGSGTSSPLNSAKAANSRRRPSRVASAISGSMWSVKNWNGARSPYSSPWNSIGVKGDKSVQNAASAPRLDRQPVAERAVADLVVVGGEDDEALGRHVVGGRPEAALAERRVGPVVHVRALEGLGQQRDRVELLVPALGLAGEQDAQRVVEVVGPGGVAAVAAELAARA